MLMFLVTGQNLVSESSVQVQEASEREGHGRTKRTESGITFLLALLLYTNDDRGVVKLQTRWGFA